jgi:hypothetical protein
LLKWQFQAGQRSGGWTNSIDDSREQLGYIFESSPSLRRFAAESFSDAYPRARRAAARETGLPLKAFPEACPFSFDQLMDEDFFPAE